jgi:gliding motility-associated-like protein
LSGLGNKLWIFNRWGDLIYETDNYQNNWGGTHNGMTVPDGTYFYILQTNSGEEKQSSIEVRR